MAFEPRHLQRHPNFMRFEDPNGLEYEVHGDESRLQLAYQFAESVGSLLIQAEGLLYDFMKHSGKFSAEFVEVLAEPDTDGCVLLVRHSFVADADPHGFGYTYFDVLFRICEPPLQRFWPVKFVVGFW